jgi:hypothetical protein
MVFNVLEESNNPSKDLLTADTHFHTSFSFLCFLIRILFCFGLVCLPDVHMWEDRPALWQFEEVGPLKGGA